MRHLLQFIVIATFWLGSTSFVTQAGISAPYGAYFAQIADGQGWKSKLVLRNSGTSSQRFRLEFRREDGTQLNLNFTDGRSNWFIEDVLFGGGSFFLETAGIGDLKQRWVRLSNIECASYDSGANCGAGINNRIMGSMLFQQNVPGRPPFEASIPLDTTSPTASLSFDNTGGYVTSIAILNPAIQAGQRVRLTFKEQNGGVVAQRFVDMGPRRRVAFATTDYPETIGKKGTLVVSSDSGSNVVVFGLLFNSSGAFSALLAFEDF